MFPPRGEEKRSLIIFPIITTYQFTICSPYPQSTLPLVSESHQKEGHNSLAEASPIAKYRLQRALDLCPTRSGTVSRGGLSLPVWGASIPGETHPEVLCSTRAEQLESAYGSP